MKHIFFYLFIIPAFLFAANPEPKEINWITFEQAIALNKTNPKPIIVDVYTDWCHWCKVMDKETYTNTTITDYINQNYYAVKFDAEQKEPITFNGQTFKYITSGRRGHHEFAEVILKGQLSYPSTVFFNKEEKVVYVAPGYLKKPVMEKLINFMHQEVYLTKDWDTFEQGFKSKL
ncbi:uncharacterized protein YyaL (SSP411 family) [Wenyingzhuangia heitensis]|uniref:Uncharacterized protein YyaL (SSP411 family) n=1 Tax=Wenyingzhuangia heitensis TaxID=1487859 RepID=A0ABX0UBL0_9FLAO|nr:DUF255 domain-containing protein [Wenyingzhuangia heitensis]NIJ46118.1 uncharacterized protein YyaL (SSP411 family) [Wenyingzhuangia heitensis]